MTHDLADFTALMVVMFLVAAFLVAAHWPQPHSSWCED